MILRKPERLFGTILIATLFSYTSASKSIFGCPDLDVLETEAELSPDAIENLLLCFCKVREGNNVAVNCLYGSTIDHLQRATNAVKNASMQTTEISMQHMEFPATGLPAFAVMAPALRSLEIRECANFEPLLVPEIAFEQLHTSLKTLTIHSCSLESVPTAVDKLDVLESLILSNNKLTSLSESTFARKKALKYLDVSGNFINNIEEDAFDSLQQLETLLIGDHNFMNETVLEQIGKLHSLTSLDFSRADGITQPPMEIFDSLPQLKVLKLSGCSITSLDAGIFSPLKNLEQLDLRVNLIENITGYAFDGLNNLKRLSLAGNFIRKLDKDFWMGVENLEDLDLGWNELRAFPTDCFVSMKSLQTLNLRHNPLKELNGTGLPNLKNLIIAETELKHMEPSYFKEYTSLETVDISHCNITEIPTNLFDMQQSSLKSIHMEKNKLRTIPAEIIERMVALEEIDISGNPFICDDQLGKLIDAINIRYKNSAKEGKNFLLKNANDTVCDRPYNLHNEGLLSLDSSQLKIYDAQADTTTVATTTTIESIEESTTPLKFPDLFVGDKNSNETLFKEEPRRALYDIEKTDDSSLKKTESVLTVPLTLGVMAAVSLITLIAVGVFIKKKKTRAVADVEKRVPASIEDTMVEIELDTQPRPHQ